MYKIREMLRQGSYEELWRMCCGFLDIGLERFMSIQKRLLLEQIELLKQCELGRKVMRGAMPETVDELRVFLASGRKIIETAKLEAIIALLDDSRAAK